MFKIGVTSLRRMPLLSHRHDVVSRCIVPVRPFSIFNKMVDNLKKEVTKDKDLQSSIKLFQQKLTQVNENETIKAAKEFISKAKIVDPISRRMRTDPAERRKRIAAYRLRMKQQSAAEHQNPFEQEGFQRLGRSIRELFIDEASSSAFGTVKSKRFRDRNRRARAENAAALNSQSAAEFPPTESTALIHVGNGEPAEGWLTKLSDKLRHTFLCKYAEKMRRAMQESNNVFIFVLRAMLERWRDRFRGIFRETEPAKVVLAVRRIDPAFTTDKFLQDCREFIIPDLIESFLNEDLVRLKMWTSEATFNLLKANLAAMKRPNCILDGQLFDLRNVDLAAMKMVDDRPMLIVSFQTQQIMVLRDAKTGELVEGDEEKLERYEYICAFTKKESESSKTDETNGWSVIEISIRKL